ncbi:N-acetyltransferase [Hokovirus HKV1]|uniref:N-acetyltransferase n=1 Tax=Hokovirus HKV1 TaxID=1977638 RepID=A0A1V0SHC8_9VIRU|nr:N-acetyltransferase [Hokovirus HKV1]
MTTFYCFPAKIMKKLGKGLREEIDKVLALADYTLKEFLSFNNVLLNSTILVVFDNGNLVGCAVYGGYIENNYENGQLFKEYSITLGGLAITYSYRNKGIGTKIIQYLLLQLSKKEIECGNKFKTYYINVRVENTNAKAISFYKNKNFIQFAIVGKFLCMALNLDENNKSCLEESIVQELTNQEQIEILCKITRPVFFCRFCGEPKCIGYCF